MRPRTTLLLPIALLYALFVSWYTDFGGPLSDEEITSYLTQMKSRNGAAPELLARIEKFMREDTGRQFFMLNAIDYNENPPDVEGAEPGETAEQLLGRYMAYMYPNLFKRASHPIIAGPAAFTAMDLVGIDNAEVWDMGAMMRYRSRRTFMEIVANHEMRGRHEFKVAALTKTIAYPVEAEINLGDPRGLVGLLLLAIYGLLEAFLPRKPVTAKSEG
ncbi:MAG: hypothetical protein HKN19_06385 [Halioglobus sp.]|nr:hypothetical protein [Halioglobus sp.]